MAFVGNLTGRRGITLACSRITLTSTANVLIMLGLVFVMTPAASAVTHFFTDGSIHASWRVPENGDEGEAEAQAGKGDNSPPPFPDNVEFCEFGNHDLDHPDPDVIVTKVSTETVVAYIAACEKFIEGDDYPTTREHRSAHRQKRSYDFKAIYPGTKWCGTGNIARNYNDLGMLRSLDRCCREHDDCPDIIRNGHERGGVRNSRGYTMLNCDCDETFRECLYDINDFAANLVGGTYFNLMANKCYLPKPGSGTSSATAAGPWSYADVDPGPLSPPKSFKPFHPPGLKGLQDDGKWTRRSCFNFMSPASFFCHFFTPTMMGLLCDWTNQNAVLKAQKRASLYRQWCPVTVDELYRFFALLLYISIFRVPRLRSSKCSGAYHTSHVFRLIY